MPFLKSVHSLKYAHRCTRWQGGKRRSFWGLHRKILWNAATATSLPQRMLERGITEAQEYSPPSANQQSSTLLSVPLDDLHGSQTFNFDALIRMF